MRALVIPVGADSYAIATDRVREVGVAPPPTSLPGVPAAVLGVINLRGEIVPLLDTAALLGLAVTEPPLFIVVVRSPSGPAALTATAMPEVVALDENLGPSEMAGSSGRYRTGARLVVMLDVDAVLAVAYGEPSLAFGGSR